MLDYALRYAAIGWRVFPVHSIRAGACTCGEAGCPRAGKHPVRQLVRDGLLSATTTPELIRAWWANARWANIAVRTGPESGIWALDVDTRDDKRGAETLDALERDHGPLPETVEAITGSGGRHLVFRYPTDRRIGSGTNKLGPGLDIRGEGGYIVVEPSLHASGQAYAWEGSSDPLESVAPVAAPTWLLDALEESQDSAAAQPGSGPSLPQAQVLELRQALGYLDADDYDVWVRVGMCLQASGAGDQAFGLWNEWSQLSSKYDAKSMRRKWSSFRDRAGGLELASIFATAQARGWTNPASREAQAFEAVTGMTMEQANRRSPAIEVVEPQKREVEPFPVPGLDDVCRWIESMAPVSYPAVTQHAVLALVGAAAARRYVTPQGDPLSLYLGASARSIGEIRYAHHAVFHALEAAGLRRIVRNSRIPSPASLYKSLLRAPALLYQSDDYGGLAAFARRQPSGMQEAVLSLLAQLYDGKAIPLDHADEAGLKAGSFQDEQPVFYSPSVSLFALVGHDHLVTLLRASELGRGALEQILLAVADDTDAQVRDPVAIPIPPWLAPHLRTIRGVAEAPDLDCASIFQGNALLVPTLTTVPFPPILTEFYSPLEEVSHDRALRPVQIAARGTLRRISAGLAVWRDPLAPKIDADILGWAARYVAARLRELVEQYEMLHGEDGRASVYDYVLTRVLEAKATGLAKRDLIAACKPFRNLDGKRRGELIEQMLSDETIFEVGTTNKAGPRGKRLIAAKFVKKPADLGQQVVSRLNGGFDTKN